MRKIKLQPTDYEMFDSDINLLEFEFFQRHRDVFKQMFVNQVIFPSLSNCQEKCLQFLIYYIRYLLAMVH